MMRHRTMYTCGESFFKSLHFHFRFSRYCHFKFFPGASDPPGLLLNLRHANRQRCRAESFGALIIPRLFSPGNPPLPCMPFFFMDRWLRGLRQRQGDAHKSCRHIAGSNPARSTMFNRKEPPSRRKNGSSLNPLQRYERNLYSQMRHRGCLRSAV